MMICAEIQQGLAMELRLTGATSVLPQQAAQRGQYTATEAQEADEDEEEEEVTVSWRLPVDSCGRA